MRLGLVEVDIESSPPDPCLYGRAADARGNSGPTTTARSGAESARVWLWWQVPFKSALQTGVAAATF